MLSDALQARVGGAVDLAEVDDVIGNLDRGRGRVRGGAEIDGSNGDRLRSATGAVGDSPVDPERHVVGDDATGVSEQERRASTGDRVGVRRGGGERRFGVEGAAIPASLPSHHLGARRQRQHVFEVVDPGREVVTAGTERQRCGVPTRVVDVAGTDGRLRNARPEIGRQGWKLGVDVRAAGVQVAGRFPPWPGLTDLRPGRTRVGEADRRSDRRIVAVSRRRHCRWHDRGRIDVPRQGRRGRLVARQRRHWTRPPLRWRSRRDRSSGCRSLRH